MLADRELTHGHLLGYRRFLEREKEVIRVSLGRTPKRRESLLLFPATWHWYHPAGARRHGVRLPAPPPLAVSIQAPVLPRLSHSGFTASPPLPWTTLAEGE